MKSRLNSCLLFSQCKHGHEIGVVHSSIYLSINILISSCLFTYLYLCIFICSYLYIFISVDLYGHNQCNFYEFVLSHSLTPSLMAHDLYDLYSHHQCHFHEFVLSHSLIPSLMAHDSYITSMYLYI